MGDKLDDLFSPERLRSHWNREEPAQPAAPAQPRQPPKVLALAQRLQALTQGRYPGPGGAALEQLAGRLLELAQRRWADEPPPDEELEPLELALELLLAQIEDLGEALELGRSAG